MKLKLFFSLILVFALSLWIVQTQAQPVTSNKYIKTAVDTFTYGGYATTLKGMITNDGDTDMVVYWSNSAGAKLLTSAVKIPAGKTLLFNCYTKKIFRVAMADSCYSQLVIGDIHWGSILNSEESEQLKLPNSTFLVSNNYAFILEKPGLIRRNYSLNAFRI